MHRRRRARELGSGAQVQALRGGRFVPPNLVANPSFEELAMPGVVGGGWLLAARRGGRVQGAEQRGGAGG